MSLSAIFLKRCFPVAALLRSFSSGTPISFTLSFEPVREPESEPETNPQDDLRSRIFRLRLPKRSATAALDKWVRDGNDVKLSELRQIAKDLRKSQRYKHALEIMTWMESQGRFRLRSSDHAARIDLITKVHSSSEAEAYFNRLSGSAAQKDSAIPLLHSYVKERDLEKAEALMQRLLNSGLAVNPYLFNEMMKLYAAAGQFKKVLSVIRHMKLSKIPLNIVSYSLWLNASFEVSGASSAEMVYKEMKNDENVEVGWSTYATLANVYTKAGLHEKAFAALKISETKLSVRDHLAYSFIMTSYAALNDKDGVLRMWESSKNVPRRITCANYMSVMSSLIKTGDIEAAERIFREWESQCHNYDVRVSNVLLGAYMRNGWMDKVEALHLRTLERGGRPNYKTWEILMEGWVNQGKMDKAVEAMKRGFSKLNGCMWKPPFKIVLAIAEHFETQGYIKEMRSYVKTLHGLNLMSLPVYKSALRAHIKAEEEALDILQMMEGDEIELDEETQALIQCANEPRNPDMKMNIMPCPPPLESFFSRVVG